MISDNKSTFYSSHWSIFPKRRFVPTIGDYSSALASFSVVGINWSWRFSMALL